MSTTTLEFTDWREYYYQLRQETYYLNESNCAIIGFPVTPNEEPVAFLNIKKEEPLYDRSSNCIILFQNGSDDKLEETHYGEDILRMSGIDTSNIATDVYLMVGGKLKPLYSISMLSEHLDLPLIGLEKENYLWSKSQMERLGVPQDDIKPVAMSFSDFSGIIQYYDCRPYLEQRGEKLISFEEYDQICNFRLLKASDLFKFPKSWGIDAVGDKLEGLEKVGYVDENELLVELTDKAIEGTPIANVLKPSEVDEEALILHIRELDGFKSILNLGKKKITSLTLLGILEDGRAVFEANQLKKEHSYGKIAKIFFAKYRL
ncbi:hypothetical protein P4679_30790 [Priestia megaterium]|uniref:hypothetical protein n=1 Tax=Priestia megaterium TaxID=1404 RepID=UPI002E1D3AD9|nr:hypothetical protein [Priestia megaterium]